MFNASVSRASALFAVALVACAGRGPPEVTVRAVPVVEAIVAEHPDFPGSRFEVFQDVLVAYDRSTQEPLEVLEHLGHLEADLDELGDEANVLVSGSVVTEGCAAGCLCPQRESAWWERELFVVDDELAAIFADRVLEIEVCDNETSRAWREGRAQIQAPR